MINCKTETIKSRKNLIYFLLVFSTGLMLKFTTNIAICSIVNYIIQVEGSKDNYIFSNSKL